MNQVKTLSKQVSIARNQSKWNIFSSAARERESFGTLSSAGQAMVLPPYLRRTPWRLVVENVRVPQGKKIHSMVILNVGRSMA
jgi:hypothetical protein